MKTKENDHKITLRTGKDNKKKTKENEQTIINKNKIQRNK